MFVPISDAGNGSNSNSQVNIEDKKSFTVSSTENSRSGSASRNNLSAKRTSQNGSNGQGM